MPEIHVGHVRPHLEFTEKQALKKLHLTFEADDMLFLDLAFSDQYLESEPVVEKT